MTQIRFVPSTLRFALELPTVALEAVNPLADLDFAIAYKVLADSQYSEHYARRPFGRKLILDNGFHELAACASWDRLIDAARRCNPDYIIIPDPHGPYDVKENAAELRKAIDIIDPARLALVVAGTGEARNTLVYEALELGIGMLCFSRMVPRLQWFREIKAAVPQIGEVLIHLLGVSSLEELQLWREEPGWFSTDTSKPAKAALLGRRLDDGEPLRGMPVVSKTLFDEPMTLDQIELCKTNVQLLRQACGG